MAREFCLIEFEGVIFYLHTFSLSSFAAMIFGKNIVHIGGNYASSDLWNFAQRGLLYFQLQ